jgi:hypothetical protein
VGLMGQIELKLRSCAQPGAKNKKATRRPAWLLDWTSQ